MAEETERRFLAPIQIRYDGLDAQAHQIDMAMLGESLQGAARLIGVAAHIAATAEYTNRAPSMQFRVLTAAPAGGSVTVAAILHFAVAVSPIVLQLPPPEIVEKIVNYILSSLSRRPQNERELELIGELVQANRELTQANTQLALEGMGAVREVALAAIQAVKEAAQDQRPAARHFAAPVGETAAVAAIGNPETAFIVDAIAKEAINFEPAEEILDASQFRLKLTELDIKTGTGKAEIHGFDATKRYQCKIVDPIVFIPQNAYSSAFNDQRWIDVTAKPHFQDGDLSKLTILDTPRIQSAA